VRREDATPPMDIVGCYGCGLEKREAEAQAAPITSLEQREDAAMPPMDIVGCYGCEG
jgi:hypothetical protein